MGPLKIHHHQPSLFFRSAWCSYHLPVVISLLTLHNDCFTPPSPKLYLRPHSQPRTSPPTSQRNRSHRENTLNSFRQSLRPSCLCTSRLPLPSCLSRGGSTSIAAQFFLHLCSRSCPLVSSGTSFPPRSSFSHLQQQQRPSSSPTPPPAALSPFFLGARFLERAGSTSCLRFCTSHSFLCPTSVWPPPPIALLKQLSISLSAGNIF